MKGKTRSFVLCKMNGNGAGAVLDCLAWPMKGRPLALRKRMIYDRGSVMACRDDAAARMNSRLRKPLG